MLFDTLNEFDRLGSALFSAINGVSTPLAMPLDVHRESDRYVLDADLPGVDPKSIDLSVDGDWLTIRAERSTNTDTQDGQWLVHERSDASVVRRIALGQDIDVDKIEANYRDGVLSVVVPIAEGARPRKITIGNGQSQSQQALSQGASAPGAEGQAKDTAQGKAEPAHLQVS